MKGQNRQAGFSTVEIVLAALVIVALAAIGVLIYRQHQTPKPAGATNTTQTTNQQQTTTTTQPPADPYAGWKMYTLAEDSTISFRYPSDWTVLEDTKDTSSVPYNRFFKIAGPTQYHGNDIVFTFRYSPGSNNQITQACAHYNGHTNIVNSEDVTVGSHNLKLITTANSINDTKTINMALVDSSDCYVAVSSGVIEATESLNSQSAPTYSIDLNTWQSLPESKTLELVFKSFKF